MSASFFVFVLAMFSVCNILNGAVMHSLHPGSAITAKDIIPVTNILREQRAPLTTSIHQITPTSPSQVAGISRSRLGYSQTTGVAAGIVVPGQPGVKWSFYFEGTVTLNGTLTSEVEDSTDNLVVQFSSEFQEWYNEEKKSLKARAGGGFFSFFQAAANYGYSKTDRTEEILESEEFKRFSDKAGATLKSVTPQVLTGKFGGNYEAISVGKREVLTIFGYIFINQITLDSGKIFNVVSDSTLLTLTDQSGNIVNDTTTVDIERPNIGDNIIDSKIGILSL